MMGESAAPALPSSEPDHYAVLGLTRQATAAEIKAAYRSLVKRHHPDAGGDERRILALNAAWEVLRDGERRRRYDGITSTASPSPATPAATSTAARGGGLRRSTHHDQDLAAWLQQVYVPVDRLLGQVINPFPAALRALSADPYDDELMEAFCRFLQQSQARLEKVETLYRSRACPASARGFGISLYHCLSQVKDALTELERYTMGYVDGYLRDGREMLREARQRRSRLKEERRRLDL
jgi:molecular chaperone DnaJ